MSAESTVLLKKYWFGELDTNADELKSGSVIASAHGTSLIGYAGIIAFKYQESCILSAPAPVLALLKEKIKGHSTQTLFDRATLSNCFRDSLTRVIGPAWIGKITANHFHPCHSRETRLLKDSDWNAFNKFLSENDPTEVEHSALLSGRETTVGVFHQNEIVAAASYEILENLVAHIGVLTSKKNRGKGFGKQALSLITQIALSEKLGIQYQTLLENSASLRMAQSLGFKEFAQTFAIRLI